MRNRFPVKLSALQIDAVDAEVAQEKAASLRRVFDRLTVALDALRRWDGMADEIQKSVCRKGPRQELVGVAAEALWYYVVQREACGLRDTERVMQELEIPTEVRLRMGPRPSGA